MFAMWKLMDFAPREVREKEVFQPGYDDTDWYDVPVPGDVHRALLAAGRIPDPFYDRNEGRVRREVLRLPRRQREVLTLRVDAELPFAEIAETLGVTENAAKVSFHHATRRLRDALAEGDLP
jgi:RNA polymerase sigma-70 factor (ECF subfamily)